MSDLMKLKAKLRTCASCEWIFHLDEHGVECPKCHFGSYGAHYVYGNYCYRFAKTQKPWYDRKMSDYSAKLYSEISKENKPKSSIEKLMEKLC